MIDKIKDLIREPIENLNFTLDDVLYEKEGSCYFLRIIIDKDGFVNIDDCVLVSKTINPLIDAANLLNESYILDVCSKEKGCE